MHSPDVIQPPVMPGVEAVEKVNFDRILRHGKKYHLSGCSVRDDLMLGKGQETPENHPLIVMLDFFYRLVRHKWAAICTLGVWGDNTVV
jgi:hypothetical protein